MGRWDPLQQPAQSSPLNLSGREATDYKIKFAIIVSVLNASSSHPRLLYLWLVAAASVLKETTWAATWMYWFWRNKLTWWVGMFILTRWASAFEHSTEPLSLMFLPHASTAAAKGQAIMFNIQPRLSSLKSKRQKSRHFSVCMHPFSLSKATLDQSHQIHRHISEILIQKLTILKLQIHDKINNNSILLMNKKFRCLLQ